MWSCTSVPTLARVWVLLIAGMTGWIQVLGSKTHYRPEKDEGIWPPRFVKFILKVAERERPTLANSLIPDIWGHEVAFVDARRLGRIRLVDAVNPFSVEHALAEIMGLI